MDFFVSRTKSKKKKKKKKKVLLQAAMYKTKISHINSLPMGLFLFVTPLQI